MRDLDRWKDKVELSLDGRQIFFLFFGSAVAACLVFVLGVLVGKRLEARALALQPAPVEDPLAALDQLGDADEASVRLVTTGELLALRETQRSLTFVNLYGYNVDALILNRQKNIPRSVADTFAAWPILCLTLYDRDIIGRNLLSEMALALFPPPAEPDAVLMAGQVQRLTKASNGYVLSLRLPFVHEDDIDVLQHHGQLILQIGSMRRVLRLPSPVDQLNAADAVLEEGTLEVHFR